MVHQLHVDARQDEAGARGDDEKADVVDRSCARPRAHARPRCIASGVALAAYLAACSLGDSGTERLLDGPHEIPLRLRQLVGEQADTPLEPRPELRDEAQHLVADHPVRRHRRCQTIDRDRGQQRTGEG